MQTIPRTRLDALTGLRFFAAMAVYLHHHPKPDYFPDVLATFFLAGYNGVTIFFVLSGFVIGMNYFDSLIQPTGRKLLSYAVARFARVYPLYLLVLILVWLTHNAPLDPNFIQHILAVQTWSPDLGIAYGYNRPGWSIGVEFFLYACFPLLVIPLARIKTQTKWLWALAFALMAILMGLAFYFQASGLAQLPWEDLQSAHHWLYRTPLTRLGDFTLGIIASLLFAQLSTHSLGELRWRALTYGAIVAFIALMIWDAHLYSAFSWDASFAPLAFALILGLALAPSTIIGRFLARPAVVLLGEASYALYLIHFFLMDIFRLQRFEISPPIVSMTVWIIFFLVCVASAVGLHLLIEKPIRQWIRNQFSKRFAIG